MATPSNALDVIKSREGECFQRSAQPRSPLGDNKAQQTSTWN